MTDPRCASAWHLLFFGIELHAEVEQLYQALQREPLPLSRSWGDWFDQARGGAGQGDRKE
jgi:hypothetical protein